MSREGIFTAEGKSAENLAQSYTQSTSISWDIVLFLLFLGFFCQGYIHEDSHQTVLFTEADAVLTLTGTEGAQLLCIKLSSSLSTSVHWSFWRPELIFLHSLHLHATRQTFKAQRFVGYWGMPLSAASYWAGWSHSLHPGSSSAHTFLPTLLASTESCSSTQDVLSLTMEIRKERQNVWVLILACCCALTCRKITLFFHVLPFCLSNAAHTVIF